METAYGRSKQQGERLVRESGLPSVIIRPSHVYGAGGWYAEEIVKRLKQPGRFVVIGSGRELVGRGARRGRRQRRASRPPSARPWVRSTTSSTIEPISYYEFVALTAKALGVGPPRRVPAWLARRAAGKDPVRAVMRSARSSNELIKRELGWKPRYPNAQEGVPDAVARLSA